MKILSMIFVLILNLTVSSCFVSESSADAVREKYPAKILEINSEFSGLYWINGEVLNFRLFSDGTVEYDEYPQQKTTYNTIDVKTVKNIKRVKIDKNEAMEIISIIKDDDFLKIPNKVVPQKSCIDAFINTKINFDFENLSKEIFIENHCSTLANPESTSSLFDNFPSKINELFQKIENIKNRESRGKFYN